MPTIAAAAIPTMAPVERLDVLDGTGDDVAVAEVWEAELWEVEVEEAEV